MKINYKKASLVGVAFGVLVLIVSVAIAFISSPSSFLSHNVSVGTYLIFTPYCVVQGILIVYIASMTRDKLPASKLGTGLIFGLITWLASGRSNISTLYYSSISGNLGYFMQHLKELNILESIIIYLIFGLVLVYMVDRFCVSKEDKISYK